MKTKTMSKFLAILLSVIMAVGILPMTAFATEMISSVSATITPPKVGYSPGTSLLVGDSTKYSAYIVDWFKGDTWEDAVPVEIYDVFEKGSTYFVYIDFNAKDGYEFNFVTAATINGMAATYDGIIKTSKYKCFYLSYTFPSDVVSSVSATVTELTAGHTVDELTATSGDSKKYDAVINSCYTGGNTWASAEKRMNSKDIFQADEMYWFEICFSAKTSYKFDDAATATINGKHATSLFTDADGKRYYCVPFTAVESEKLLSSVSATITEPAVGKTQATTITTGDSKKYDITISEWAKGDDAYSLKNMPNTEKYEVGQIYWLKIAVKTKNDYTLYEGTTVKVNGKTAIFDSFETANTFYYYIPFSLKLPFNSSTVTVSGISSSKNYTGKAVTQSVTVKSGSTTLKNGVDYSLSYKKNVYPGTATVTIAGKGKYQGSIAKTYTIKAPVLAAPSSVTCTLYGHDDIQSSWKKVSGASGYFVYYKKSTASSYSYKDATTGTAMKIPNLTDGAKYYVRVIPYKTINGKKYNGTGKTTSAIYTLKKVIAPKISKKSSSKVTVKWSNIAGESGYQISKSTSKSKTGTITTVKTTSGKSKVISAKKGKTYYYKVRAYKTVGSKKIYGPWSSVKSYKLK